MRRGNTGFTILVITVMLLTFFSVLYITKTTQSQIEALREYMRAKAKPSFQVIEMKSGADGFYVTVQNLGSEKVFVRKVILYKSKLTGEPTESYEVNVNKQVPVGEAFTFRIPLDQLTDFISINASLRMTIDTDRGLVTISAPAMRAQLIAHVRLPDYFTDNDKLYARFTCAPMPEVQVWPTKEISTDYYTIERDGNVVTITATTLAFGQCELKIHGIATFRALAGDWQGLQPISPAISNISPALAGIVKVTREIDYTYPIEVGPLRTVSIEVNLPEVITQQTAQPETTWSKQQIATVIDFSELYLREGDAVYYYVSPTDLVKAFVKAKVAYAVNPDGKTICPLPTGEIPSECEDLILKYAWSNKDIADANKPIFNGLPFVIPEEGDKGHHVMHVEVPLYLDEGEYIIITSFTWEDKDEKNEDKHEFIISVKDEDGYSLAVSPAIEEKEAGTTGSPFQVSYPMQVEAPVKGKYYVTIDVKQAKDIGPAEKALILNKILILKMPEAPSTMAIDIPSLFTEVDLDNFDIENLVEGIAYVEPTKNIYLYNDTGAIIWAGDNKIGIVSPNGTVVEKVPTSFIPSYDIDWVGRYDIVGGMQAGYDFTAEIPSSGGLAHVQANSYDDGLISYSPELQVSVTFGDWSLAYHYAVAWKAHGVYAELPSWYDRLTLKADDYVSSTSFTISGLEIEHLYGDYAQFTLKPTYQTVTGVKSVFDERLLFVAGLKDYSEPYDYKTGSVEWGILLKNVRRGADYLVAVLRRADTGVIVGYWTYPLPPDCDPCNILLSLDGLTDKDELLNFIHHEYILTVSGIANK